LILNDNEKIAIICRVVGGNDITINQDEYEGFIGLGTTGIDNKSSSGTGLDDMQPYCTVHIGGKLMHKTKKAI
jgi:hypothetical protein